MMAVMFSLVTVVCALALGVVADESLSQNGTYVKVLGHSGKITICNTDKCDDEAYTITMDSLQEYDQAGGAFTSPAHSYNNFAKTDFTFSPLVDTSYQSLKVQQINFTSPLESNGPSTVLKVLIIIFQESGNFTVNGDPDNATIPVEAGSVKFSYYLDNWVFCTTADNSCKVKGKGADGAYLVFKISIKSSSGDPVLYDDTDSDALLYRYPDNTTLSLVTGTLVDNVYQKMADGYPEVTSQGSSSVLAFYLPKGQHIEYDPELSLGSPGNNPVNAAVTVTSTLFPALLILAAKRLM
jgi:hypothetical protein